ncbi:MAG: TetR/AcrR family transcriptional regulator [Phycisphaerae bacterium]
MKVGRPKEFDTAEVLDKAMEVFWSKGYEATSITDLLKRMRINRGSLYATFGDKRNLFLQALARYRERLASCALADLQDEESPLERIRETLESFAEKAEQRECWGCLVTNAVVEVAAQDKEITLAAQAALGDIREAFAHAVTNAQRRGDVPESADPEALSHFLLGITQGLVVMAKAGFPASACRETASIALKTLISPA